MPSDADTRFDRALALVQARVDTGQIPGGVLAVQGPDGRRRLEAVGRRSHAPSAPAMTEDTWFDLASVSKVIFTTERILAHVRAGRIELDAPLTSVIPDLMQYDVAGAWQRQITFRQCLGHDTGLPAVFPIYTYGEDPDRLRAFVLQRDWPRQEAQYSCINYILLGIALERLEGQRLRAMTPGAGFAFAGPAGQTAPTEHCAWRGRVLEGEVHDENCAALAGAGNAGLFGTAGAVLDFAGGLLAAEAAGSDHTRLLRQPVRPTRGHGWELPHPGWSGGEGCSDQTIGHTGFTGTGVWIDFAAGQAWTLLTNRVHPTRHADSGIFDLRRAVGHALYGKDL